MIKTFYLLLFLIMTSPFMGGCYRMPTADDYSLIPSTNNPQITRQRDESHLPKISY
jgi:hypothetical protein